MPPLAALPLDSDTGSGRMGPELEGPPGSHLLSQVVPHPEFWSQDSKGEQPPLLPLPPHTVSGALSHFCFSPSPPAAHAPASSQGLAQGLGKGASAPELSTLEQLGRSSRTPLAFCHPKASSAPEHNKDHHH